jgi:molybdopterin molybdotransferase
LRNPLLSFTDAIQMVRDSARACRPGTETVHLSKTAGRVIAGEVRSHEFIPAYDNSAMDGFAVRSSDLKSGQNILRIAERRIAGDMPGFCSEARVAVQIMTGAPMPGGGFDLILKVEETEITRDDTGVSSIHFDSRHASAGFVRKRGADFKPGDLLVSPGTVVDAKLILGLAALGVSEVPVFRKPKIAILSTGNELVPFDEPVLPEGMIRNSTAPYLMEMLSGLGCEVRNFGLIADEVKEAPLDFDEALRAALAEEFDLILTTGAVSMGVHDFVKPSVEKNGGRVLFHRVAIRPGKPVLFADFPNHPKTRLLGLPGNPISTVVGTDFFVRPYLRAWFGMEELVLFRGKLLGAAPDVPAGLRGFLKARVTPGADGVFGVEILHGQGSFMIHSLTRANAWAVVPEAGGMKEGGIIEFQMFSERMDS